MYAHIDLFQINTLESRRQNTTTELGKLERDIIDFYGFVPPVTTWLPKFLTRRHAIIMAGLTFKEEALLAELNLKQRRLARKRCAG